MNCGGRSFLDSNIQRTAISKQSPPRSRFIFLHLFQIFIKKGRQLQTSNLLIFFLYSVVPYLISRLWIPKGFSFFSLLIRDITEICCKVKEVLHTINSKTDCIMFRIILAAFICTDIALYEYFVWRQLFVYFFALPCCIAFSRIIIIIIANIAAQIVTFLRTKKYCFVALFNFFWTICFIFTLNDEKVLIKI